MNKYIITYHAPIEALKQMENASPEEAKKGMDVWMQWAEKCGDHLVDLGSPLGGGQKLNVDGTADSSERQICGYSILEAENIEHAKELLSGHPHLSGWNNACEIEIHESLPMPA